MALVLALINCSRDPGTLSFGDWGKGRVVRELEQQIMALGLGTHTGVLDVQKDPAHAGGVLKLSSASGSVGGTIGGTTVTAAASGGDAASADLVAAAIIANTTVNQWVTAVSRVATQTVTISSGSGAVSITVNAPSGAVGNTDHATPRTYTVTWATSDTVTAAALVALINADGTSPVIASNSAGVITLYARRDAAGSSGATNTNGNLIAVSASGTGVTAGGSALAGGGTNANVLVSGLVPGSIGMGITLAASGTGVTAPTGANLVAGVGTPGNSFTC